MESLWQVEQIPILKDNFVFVIHDQKKAIVIDPGESGPVLQYLESKNLKCEMILITHHHSDHIHGLLDIKNRFDCPVYAPLKNKRQLHFGITNFIDETETIHFEDLEIHPIPMPGHTLGHMAYWIPKMKWLFSGDVLFSLGCGRVFEGTFEQMFETLQKIKSLPEDTQIYCTHDYYSNNRKFCEQEGFDLKGYEPHLPLELKQELRFNPFLKAQNVQAFSEIREKRNHF